MSTIDEELKVIQARRKELYDDVIKKQVLSEFAWKEYQAALEAYLILKERDKC